MRTRTRHRRGERDRERERERERERDVFYNPRYFILFLVFLKFFGEGIGICQ
jgi:hypothetical protein